MTDEEKLAYYEDAMRRGLESRLIPKFFTTVGKMKVTIPVQAIPPAIILLLGEDTQVQLPSRSIL